MHHPDRSFLLAASAELESSAQPALGALAQAQRVGRFGRVLEARGTVIKVSGLTVRIGQVCRVYEPGSNWQLKAEVIGIVADGAILQPLGQLRGLMSSARVEALGNDESLAVGPSILGRVIDANGLPIDGGTPLVLSETTALIRAAPPAMSRRPVGAALETGVAALDALLACARGQRFGVFAPAAAGKSKLLGMLAAYSQADVTVVALIGERGREAREFIGETLAHNRARMVVVVATSDEPPLMRVRAAHAATAIAEYFRDQGREVLLLVDSLTRYARALRDVGLANGEPPARNGFPPSVFSALPLLLERAGSGPQAAISAFYTMLLEDDEARDPIAEEAKSILDGHIVLSRRLATQGHFPAIDVLASASRLMDRVISAEHACLARRARALLAKYHDLELLIQIGEYQHGKDRDADAAVAAFAPIMACLRQAPHEARDLQAVLHELRQAVGPQA